MINRTRRVHRTDGGSRRCILPILCCEPYTRAPGRSSCTAAVASETHSERSVSFFTHFSAYINNDDYYRSTRARRRIHRRTRVVVVVSYTRARIKRYSERHIKLQPVQHGRRDDYSFIRDLLFIRCDVYTHVQYFVTASVNDVVLVFQNGFVECAKDQCPDEQGCYMLQDVFVDPKGCCRRCKGALYRSFDWRREWNGRRRRRIPFVRTLSTHLVRSISRNDIFILLGHYASDFRDLKRLSIREMSC